MRCVLIPPAGESWELLPVGVIPSDVFGRASAITSDAAVLAGVGSVELKWQQSQLNCQPNPLASSLANTTVCGDCVAVLRRDLDAEGHGLRAALDDAMARCTSPAPASRQPGHSRQQQRRSRDDSLARTPAATARRVEAPPGAAPSSGAADACEPRQQLLWMLAGRATSLSWERSAPSAAQPNCREGKLQEQAPAEEQVDEASMQRACSSTAPADAADHNGAAASPWSTLSPELIGHIISAAGYSVPLARTMSQVSRSWRASLLEDRCTWRQLRFGKVSPSTRPAGTECPLPWLVLHAAQAGNLSACVAAARLCEQAHALERGAKYWGRAARLGHPEAQWRVGLALYKGIMGQQRDPEEAAMWLSRAAKQLAVTVEGAEGGEQTSRSPPGSLPLTMTTASCRSTLSQAAHILAILHLDGEGTKQDTAVAIYWLKMASCCGCAEAGRMLGSLFRNGQY